MKRKGQKGNFSNPSILRKNIIFLSIILIFFTVIIANMLLEIILSVLTAGFVLYKLLFKELVIKPIVEFRNVKNEIAYSLINDINIIHYPHLSNEKTRKDVSARLSSLSARLCSSFSAIPVVIIKYRCLSSIFDLPSKENIKSVSVKLDTLKDRSPHQNENIFRFHDHVDYLTRHIAEELGVDLETDV